MNLAAVDRSLPQAAAERFFDRLARRYSTKARYPGAVLTTSISTALRYIGTTQRDIVDIGCGDGYPASRLLKRRSSLRFTLIDISSSMLSIAAERFVGTRNAPRLIHADFNKLALAKESADVIWSCCSIQFAKDLGRQLRKWRTALRVHGLLVLAFVAQEDLRIQLFHRYFPAFHAVDLKRHLATDQIIAALQKAKFRILEQRKIRYSVSFPSRRRLIQFIASKPFSGFAYLPDREFEAGFRQFIARVGRVPERNLHSPGRFTVIVAGLSK